MLYNALIDPRTSEEIGLHLGVSQGFVRKVIQQYNRLGASGLESPGKGGRRNCYLSWDAEKQLIDSFKEKARRGQVATAIQIKQAYELTADCRLIRYMLNSKSFAERSFYF